MEIYVVQPNDTIYSIAKKYGIAVSKLIRDNAILRPNELVSGQTIVIVYPKQTYIVQEGDTLKSIAATFGVAPMQLLRNNPFLSNSILHPGIEITISYNTSGKTITHGFVYPYINKDTLKKTLPNLTYITIYNYRTVSGGKNISYYDDTDIIRISKEYGTIPLMMLTTLSPQGEPDIETAYSIILNDEYQEVFITDTLKTLKEKNYLGATIIFNYINPSNQNLYENFVTKLSNRLTSEGYVLFITVNTGAKYTDNLLVFEKNDYAGISEITSNIIFLQFIWGINYGPPQPVFSIDALQTFIDFVITTVPPDKVSVGNSLISYDWKLPYIPGKSFANSLSVNSALSLAHDVKATIEFDEVSQSPFFTYSIGNYIQKEDHIVWTIDARSILALVNLILEAKLKGAAFWNLMTYLPQLWLVMNTHFETEKLLADSLFQ